MSQITARVPQSVVEALDVAATQLRRSRAQKGELRGLRRIRVGHYRVVYEVLEEALVVLLVRVAHRMEVYRQK